MEKHNGETGQQAEESRRTEKGEEMKVLSLFSGIGAFEKALDNLQIPYVLAGFSEIDKYAVKSYCAIHGVDESMNLGDITKIDEKALPKDIDLITYRFPCQDISLAGKQKGLFNDDGTQTRSGLFFEALRIIEATKPKIAIAENVKNLTGKKFKEQFELVLKSLEEAGYINYWKVLNAKDYGIPQNRERVFIISIRKDIDKGFEFPEPFPLKLRLKDMLDAEVDEKFYLSNKGVNGLLNAFVDGREHKPNLMTNETEYSPTIDTRVGSQTHRDANSIAMALLSSPVENAGGFSYLYMIGDSNMTTLIIRKLTPKECFRLMGFDDEDFHKAEVVNSNTQLYKQACNSIVVDVLEAIFTNLKPYLSERK